MDSNWFNGEPLVTHSDKILKMKNTSTIMIFFVSILSFGFHPEEEPVNLNFVGKIIMANSGVVVDQISIFDKTSDIGNSVLQAIDGGSISDGTAGIDKNNMISLIKTTSNGEVK